MWASVFEYFTAVSPLEFGQIVRRILSAVVVYSLHCFANVSILRCDNIEECVCRSYPQLRATFEEYQKLSGKDIADSISAEMSGDLKKGMLTVG